MLFQTLYSPESGIHIEQLTGVFQGQLDPCAFQNAWQKIIQRHPILRTCFVWQDQDEPLQVVLKQVDLPLVQLDWRQLSSSNQQEQLETFLQSERQQGLKLSKAPLIRLTLIHLTQNHYQFIFSYHHILMDGWSVSLIFQEFFTLYEAFHQGKTLHLAPLRPYRDYIAWLNNQNLSQAERFWRNTLQNFTQPTPLGKQAEPNSSVLHDPPNPPYPGGNENRKQLYGKQRVSLPAPATTTLKSLVKQHRLTLSTLIQGVWALLLSRYSGENDIVFGITVSGRPSDLEGVESMTGLFINTLPVRIKIAPESCFWSWLKDIQTYNLNLKPYEFSSSGQIHQWSEITAALPLYESLLVFENFPDISREQSFNLSLTISQTRFQGAQTNYALTLIVVPTSELIIDIIYDKRRFDTTTITQIQTHLLTLIQSLIDHPDQQLATLLTQIPIRQIPTIKPLPKPEHQQIRQTFTAPRNPIEEVLARIWQQLLGVEQIDMNDNFFVLGGHSLLATQAMSRLRDVFQLELPLRYLFEAPTLASLAERIQTAIRTGESLQAPPITSTSRDKNLPLSFAQQRLWFLHQLEPNSSTYNELAAVRLTGSLNVVALEKSFNDVIRRHEILRTTFTTVEGQPIQVIAPALTLTLPIIDLRDVPETSRDAEARRLALKTVQQPFNLEQEPLLRVTLLQLEAKTYILLLTMHHIICDGWSMGILVRELAALYSAFSNNQPSPLPELPIQYADFALWQREWLQGEVIDAQLAYWKRQLSPNLPVLKLPTVRPRTEVKTNRGATQSFVLPSTLSNAMQALSHQEGVTLFMTLLAGFQVLLQRYTHQDDIVVGTDVANRNRAETEPLIGFFVNLLVLRTNLSGNPSFRELLKRVREVTLGAYAHQDLPFDQLVKTLQPERKLSHIPPLFQVLFVLQNAPVPAVELPDLTLSPFEVDNEIARFDLALFMTETDPGLVGTWTYNADLFDASTIAKLSTHLETLLRNLVAQPDVEITTLDMLSDVEKEQQAVKKMHHKASKLKKFAAVQPKAVDWSQTKLVKTDFLAPSQSLPLVITPVVEDIDIVAWAKSNREFIETKLLHYGAILFRNFGVTDSPSFQQIAEAICPNLFGEYGDLPREEISGKIYGSTPYPSDHAILFHNESSHLHCYPLKIWFFCVQPAQQGGETPIVDCRQIFQLLNPQLRKTFTQKQLMYVRNYTNGLDVSWQEFFHTTNKAEVEDYCRKAGIAVEWKPDGGLRTAQVRPAIVKHPKTGESVFFNQIQLHHASYLKPDVKQSLLSLFGENNLPRHVYYGDGSPIEESVIEEIMAIYQDAQVSFPWQQGDVLMLDNMLTAHGRNPYIGSRKIVVAMGDMMHQVG